MEKKKTKKEQKEKEKEREEGEEEEEEKATTNWRLSFGGSQLNLVIDWDEGQEWVKDKSQGSDRNEKEFIIIIFFTIGNPEGTHSV